MITAYAGLLPSVVEIATTRLFWCFIEFLQRVVWGLFNVIFLVCMYGIQMCIVHFLSYVFVLCMFMNDNCLYLSKGVWHIINPEIKRRRPEALLKF